MPPAWVNSVAKAVLPSRAAEGSLRSGRSHRQQAPSAGPLEAIELYDRILVAYPTYEHNDQVLTEWLGAAPERIDALADAQILLVDEWTAQTGAGS